MQPPFNLEPHIFRSPSFRSLIRESIEFFLQTPVENLSPMVRFTGPGVYALYITGSHDFYGSIANANRIECKLPIYIGKAVPSGWRQGRIASSESPALYFRLAEHARNISQVSNLNLKDFRCRFMVLRGAESDLINTVEANLIRLHNPLWNSIVDGFGNHDPGRGRYEQAISEWDTLHPGRLWALRLKGIPPSRDLILHKIYNYCLNIQDE